MNVRSAEPPDRERITALARDSFRSSYSLSPQQIETIVEHEFDAETLDGRLDDPDATVLVAENESGDGDGVQGFIDVETGDGPTVRWLHVDPQARGEGIATALLERVDELGEGQPLTARVLDDAVEGGEFMERFGLESGGSEDVTVGGEEFSVAVFTEGHGTENGNEPTVPVPESVSVDGADRPVDHDEPVPGTDAPFFPTFVDADRSEPFGYFCSNCASTDVSADGLDRLECGECGNLHRADDWDDSYL